MKSEAIAFRLDLETFLSHPEQACNETYMGRAIVSLDDDCEDCIDVEFTALWLAVDAPSELHPFHFRPVPLPQKTKDWRDLRDKLVAAAVDQYFSPRPVTLPDEMMEAFKERLKPAGIFGANSLHC
jgi:hypothetical protein